MGMRMAAVVTGDGTVMAKELAMPELKDNEVLVKVHASLVSPGTEMSGVVSKRAAPDASKPDQLFGYANAGEVLEIKGKSNDLKKGMRVACMGGGAIHGNYACVPVNLVVPIPDEVSYAQAGYACLAATALQAVRRTEPTLGEYGVVLGLGIVGNIASQLYRLCGSRVIGWEGVESRVEIAARCGLSNTAKVGADDLVELTKKFSAPYGVDFALFAFGANADTALASVKQCMKVSADGHEMGRLVLVGGCPVQLRGGAYFGNLDIRISSRTGPGYHDAAYEHGQDYPAVFVPFTTQRNLREIVRLIAEKRLVVDPMTTHRMPLEDAGKAADLLINHPDKAVGIVFEMKH